MEEIRNVCYIGSRKIYLRLLLISFNHVNNVMGVFTCHKPKAFVCVFIKLVYDCIQWKLNVSVYMPVAMPSLIVVPVPLWRVDMSLHVSKRLKDLSIVAVVGWHCKEKYNMYSDASFCLQVPMSHTDCLDLSQWFVGYNSHIVFYLFTSRVSSSLI
jgi:hypothetical protein